MQMVKGDADRYRGGISAVRTIEHWNRLPREVLVPPFLKVLRTKLDEVLSNLS